MFADVAQVPPQKTVLLLQISGMCDLARAQEDAGGLDVVAHFKTSRLWWNMSQTFPVACMLSELRCSDEPFLDPPSKL
jgi:hypothetical protein